MNTSLWKDIRKYAKTKGTIPLDERQMNTLKDLYLEFAKSIILGFMIFMIAYGYMELREIKTNFNFIILFSSLLGCISYYYTLRFCYSNVIGIDSNFELLLIPAFVFFPISFTYMIEMTLSFFNTPKIFMQFAFFLLPILIYLAYKGANLVYLKGIQQQEIETYNGELHFRSRRVSITYLQLIIIFISFYPISYEFYFNMFMICNSIFPLAMIIYYGFTTPHNEYILNESGVIYHKTLWGRQGGIILYSEIESIEQQDSFNVGYAKDKVRILCKDGREIKLFPENAYQFCIEITNNII